MDGIWSNMVRNRMDARLRNEPDVDYERFHQWRGNWHGNESLSFVICRKCGHVAVLDEEIDILYQNAQAPDDEVLYGLGESVACLNCGATDSYERGSADDFDIIRKSEWRRFLQQGTRLSFKREDGQSTPATIVYEDYCIDARFSGFSSEPSLQRLSTGTFSCSVRFDNGLLTRMDAYAPSSCWRRVPMLTMPRESQLYRCYFSADFDENDVATLGSSPDGQVVWHYSENDRILRAVFEERTERFYSVASNVAIGVCDANILSEVLFSGIAIDGFR